MTRRTFGLSVVLAAAGCATGGLKPNAQFGAWTKGHFQIHFIYTGAGEAMFLIFPDGTTMLLDCGDFDAVGRGDLALPLLPSASRHAGEWVARYVKRVNPNGADVDYMLISHFHRDHMGTCQWCKDVVRRGGRDYYLSGFSLAAEQLHFRRAIDRTGGVFDGEELFAPSEDRLSQLLTNFYGYMKARDGLEVQKLCVGSSGQIVPLRGKADGFRVRNICANGRFALTDGTGLDAMHTDGKPAQRWNENHLSCGSVFSYGKFRFCTAGDLSGEARDAAGNLCWPEKELARTLTRPVNVAKLNHHGFRSMPSELLRALRAQVYPACTWDVLHLTDDMLERMSDPVNCPGDRLLLPGFFPEKRCTAANAAFCRAIHPSCRKGVHTVVDVPPGGETFTLTLLDARAEDMCIVDERRFSA